jgi:outer membrane protein
MILSTQLHAEDNVDASLQLQVGLATSVNTSFYHGVSEEYFVFPLVMAEYGRYYLEATNIGYRVYQGQSGQRLAIEIDRTFDGYESGDASFLSGMVERKAAWEAGVVYEAFVGGGQLKGKLMKDISDVHEGFSTRLEYERSLWQDEAHLVTWFAGGEYWDRAKTDYYFGVESSEVRPDRPAYSAPDSHSLFVGGNAFKQLNPEVTLFLSAEYRSASAEVKDSPLVTQVDQWSTYGGFFYQF